MKMKKKETIENSAETSDKKKKKTRKQLKWETNNEISRIRTHTSTNLGVEEADGGFEVRPVLSDDPLADGPDDARDDAQDVEERHPELEHHVPPIMIIVHVPAAVPPLCSDTNK